MATDFEIGRVVAIDTSQVTIELNRDLKALTLSTYEDTVEVGRINSYVIIPVGARRVVAMVTRVVMTEEAELRTDKTMVALPAARRLMKATMIGTIDGGDFTQGISSFPVLDSPVLIATKEDLTAIFGGKEHTNRTPKKGVGYCISIGSSGVFQDYEIRIDPDKFFGKHAAIIGSTGSGKSCTIATIIQSILQMPEVERTRFIILDTNGEYREAFQEERNGSWVDAHPSFRCLYIPTDPSRPRDNLVIPYWFMNSNDFVRLFRASPGVQRPVLIDALTSAREGERAQDAWRSIRSDLLTEGNRILSACRGTESRDARLIRQLCDEVLKVLECPDNKDVIAEFIEHYPNITEDQIKETFKEVRDIVREGIQREGQQYERYAAIGADKRRRIEKLLMPLLGTLTARGTKRWSEGGVATADTPRYFSKTRFRDIHLEQAMSREDASMSRARDNCATMLMRIYRLFEDKRFEFLFGPTDGDWPKPAHALATFMRDILGLPSADEKRIQLSPASKENSETETEADKPRIEEGILPFYDRQRKENDKPFNIVIVDLSLLAAEVLENVTALIGRLILEFLQRAGERQVSGIERGELPVVLVLEEAQNYVRAPRSRDDESISRDVFERIAREGRKFGLGLIVASQRPSELSKTVLSQCSSFVVHRLQNPEDLRYFREIVPGIYNQLLDQLPALAPRMALVLGECVSAPALVYMREAIPTPRSKDPKFWERWIEKSPPIPDVEGVCRKWEGEDVEANQTERKSPKGEQVVD
ncbi:Bipolar DNA helicase HerA [Dissulfuribacter thermophilus]|uniref:Bipolar DNA helicase HerA n=1 Tax=Dissulfuribacter thermophilus TaxID=1156395 RepID=A0A1B9F7N6_9BACT|nr:DUF87 domain-containing protein [Dissulfuribacter thermophilus]OCC15968.1 Bipolar DNA helicase HerA [Dissulfuribacter thermophilus]